MCSGIEERESAGCVHRWYFSCVRGPAGVLSVCWERAVRLSCDLGPGGFAFCITGCSFFNTAGHVLFSTFLDGPRASACGCQGRRAGISLGSAFRWSVTTFTTLAHWRQSNNWCLAGRALAQRAGGQTCSRCVCSAFLVYQFHFSSQIQDGYEEGPKGEFYSWFQADIIDISSKISK